MSWMCSPLLPAAFVFFVASISFPAPAGASEPIRNGDFEAGGADSINDWMTIYPRQLGTADFSVATDSPHGGDRAGRIRVDFDGGYSSYSQSIALGKKDRSLHLEAWARIDEERAGAANIAVWFTVPGHADGGTLQQSRRITKEREWTILALDAAIPEGATEAIVRLGVYGPCAASFDDAIVTISEVAITPARIVVGHGDYKVTAKGAKATISVSIPFPFGGQTPLAIRVVDEPVGSVTAIGIEKDRENRPAKLVLGGLKAGQSATLRIETLAMLRDRETADGKGVALTAKSKAPKDVKPFLEKAPGIDVDAPAIKKLASSIEKKDFGSAMESLAKLLREKLEYAGGGNQGAVECIESGKAVCTGYANVAASVAIAAGIPARVLASTTIGSRLQEHYVIEAWTEKLGWSRMESTAARFPWRDSENLILRVIYPDAERSPFDVPLFKQASSDAEVSFRMGDDTCWQGAEELESLALDAASIAAIEKAARARFEALVAKSAPGSSVGLLADGDVTSESAKRVAAIASEWVTKR